MRRRGHARLSGPPMGLMNDLQERLELSMAKRRTVGHEKEQLVLPFELKVGDVVVDDGVRLEVVGRPTGLRGGKIMRAKVRDLENQVQHEALWDAWRKLRVVRAKVA